MDEPVRVTDRGEGTMEVALFGDIDFANSPAVREKIRAAVTRARPHTICVDLGSVTFLDSSGIAVLVVAHRLANALDAKYSVDHASPAVYEHLRLTGLAELFGIVQPDASAVSGNGIERPAPGAN